MLIKLAQESKANEAEPDFIKKIFVLAAHEIETYRNATLNMQMGVGGKTQKGGATTYIDQTQQTLNNLMDHDSATTSDKELEIGWRGAEAYHFFMLAQSQLYNAQGGGNFESCMRTALRLMEYEDILVGRPVATMATLKPLY